MPRKIWGGVSIEQGLNAPEAAKRIKSYGRNVIEEEKEKPDPSWHSSEQHR
jgi:hypothetical protein